MIGFNGCSQVAMTNLNYLSDWESKSWPSLIATQLNQDYINVAQTRASNQRILRTSIDLVVNKHISTLIVGWTSFDRYEMPMSNGDFVRLGPYGTMTEYAINNQESCQETSNLHKFFYATHHNEWLCIVTFLEQIILLESLCRAYGVKLFMFNSVQDNCIKKLNTFFNKNYKVANQWPEDVSQKDYEYATNLQTKVLKFNWLMDPKYTFTDLCTEYKLPTDQGVDVHYGHPDIDAQSVIADIFVKKIKEYQWT